MEAPPRSCSSDRAPDDLAIGRAAARTTAAPSRHPACDGQYAPARNGVFLATHDALFLVCVVLTGNCVSDLVAWGQESLNGSPRDSAAARRTIPVISGALLVALALEERVAGTMAAVAV